MNETLTTQIGQHCAIDKDRSHVYAETAATACRQVFVVLSGNVPGCPVHGVVDSLEAAYDRRKQAQAQRYTQHFSPQGAVVDGPPPTSQEKEGMYFFEGAVVKVQLAVHGSGKPYAKKLNTETGKFEYTPGLVWKLKPEHKLTLEKAKEFGQLYGMCAVCGRTLTNEESIEASIGPVCRKRLL